MVSKFLRRVLGGGASSKGEPESAIAAREDYKGYDLRAAPVKEGNRWRVGGSIVKTLDGIEKTHDFVRADSFPGRDDAVAISMDKARLIVDQLGDRMFE